MSNNIFNSVYNYVKTKIVGESIGDEKNRDEGVEQEQLSALSLTIEDKDLIDISKKYTNIWEEHWQSGLKMAQDLNKAYWVGNQSKIDDEDPINNVIFEALETYLPLVTKQYPMPTITTTNDEAGIRLSNIIQKYLYHLAEELNVRIKVSQCERYRKLSFLGVIKIGWDMENDEISCRSINPQNLILDPDAEIIDGVYKGKYLGEKKSDTAEDLIAKFPKKKTFISDLVKDKLGTKIRYTEWWGQDMLWWTYKDEVLDKTKNPHYNYAEESEEEDGIQYEKQNNYFPVPKMPYIFHTVYQMEHPYDETSDITQCIPLQDIVNKRLRQIDFNADNANGGLVISGDYFDAEQGEEVSDALRNGGVVWMKRGKPNEGVFRDTGRPLTGEIFQHLTYCEQAIRNIIGVSGSSAQALSNETTVRGKIISAEKDGSRSATPTMYLELLYKNIYKWFLQMIKVYYDEIKKVSIEGKDKVQEELKISNGILKGVAVKISVKDGAMIPKDSVTRANQAIDLWTAGAIDPIGLFDKLDFDNPRELAQRLIQYQSDPIGYLQSDNVDTTVKRMMLKELIDMKKNNPENNMMDSRNKGIGSGGNSKGKQAKTAAEKSGTNQKITSQGEQKSNSGVNYESEDNIMKNVKI
jgi:hypothetical protein